mgnify:CR=1 FL=1
MPASSCNEDRSIVAPFAGVWIEIKVIEEEVKAEEVAPFAGVWIEIRFFCPLNKLLEVAPFAGVWIEILGELG